MKSGEAATPTTRELVQPKGTDALASENCHWYAKDGAPVYEVPRAKGDGMRPTTLADARKLDLVPSVTTILACAARPGLEAWKATQLLQAALTLPKRDDETVDEYAARVIEDSKAQGRAAADKGTQLHAAIERFISYQGVYVDIEWTEHISKLIGTLSQYGIDIFKDEPEHSFASPLGYGGKIDWHNDEIVIDFKTKAKVKDVKQLAWPEQCYQLSAYAVGALPLKNPRRLINVFIGIEDKEVRIHEWTPEDSDKGWEAFEHLFAFWKLQRDWNGQ